MQKCQVGHFWPISKRHFTNPIPFIKANFSFVCWLISYILFEVLYDLFQNSYILIFKCSIPLKLNFFTQNAIFRTYYLIFFTSLPFITYFPNFFHRYLKDYHFNLFRLYKVLFLIVLYFFLLFAIQLFCFYVFSSG